MMFVLILGTSATLSSCGGDDEDNVGKTDNNSVTNSSSNSAWGKGVWYTYQSYIDGVSVNKSSFEEIEKAIDNNEILDTWYISGRPYYTYATRDKFAYPDGSFSAQGNYGRLSRIAEVGIYYAIRIIDDNTLVACAFHIYVDEDMTRTDYKKLATLFNGHIFKSISLYLSETYYTYTKSNNKIMTSNGNIYTMIDGKLIQDGTSEPLVPFNPMTVYGVTQ